MTDAKGRHPGDVVACACPGCDEYFVVPERHPYKMYCSKACGQRAFRIANGRSDGARSTGVPKLLRNERGNIGRIGEPYSGTGSLWQRLEIDLAHIPQDKPELWT